MFASVARQGGLTWEHIVVTHPDDGVTADMVSQRATRDDRIVHLSASHDTAAGARNAGLDRARGNFVLFLDADDTVTRRHFHRLVREANRTSADVVMTGYRRIGYDGRTIHRRTAKAGMMNPGAVVAGPLTALHGLLFKRDLLRRIGGFDASLATNEDWDLCVRAAAQGASFYNSGGSSADYWITQGSLSSQGATMVRDRQEVARRAQAFSLTRGPAPGFDAPEDEDAPGVDAVYSALWAGAVCIAREQPTAALLEEFSAIARPAPLAVSTEMGAAALFDGLVIGFACRHAHVERRVGPHWPALVAFLGDLARLCDDDGLDRALLSALERELARAAPAGVRRKLGSSAIVPLTARIGGEQDIAAGVDQVVLRLPLLRPHGLATFAFAPAVARESGALALIARRLATELAERIQTGPGRIAALRDRSVRLVTVARRKLRTREATPEPEEPAAETNVWEDIFATENPWRYHCGYEQAKYERTLALLGDEPIERALELACAEGHFTEQLAPRVAHLTASDISPTALARCQRRCDENGLENIEYLELDFFEKPIGENWNLIVSSEVLYYMPSRDTLAAYARRVADALVEGGLFLHAHAYETSDTQARTGFDWGDVFAAGTICETFAATEGLVLERAVETELYRCEVYRKRTLSLVPRTVPAVARVSVRDELDPALAADVVWNGAVATRDDVDAQRHYRVPVLMYHAVSETGPAGLDPWRTTPEAFEHQLRFLRRRGYRSVGMEEWDAAHDQSAALAGRPIIITFDDGYENFAQHAWPILKRNGFGAHQFVVSGAVGGKADWDKWYGDPYRLMDWTCLAKLVDEGLEIGSHGHRHRALDRLTYAQIADDGRRSRETIADKLGMMPTTVAPPYGICSPAQAEALQLAGFERVFLTDGGPAPVRGAKLHTPRLEVSGGMTIDDFAALVGASETPEAADRP
jgi:peptidoglycan/xylan/chitin deacetylase (PgdA/CDA1 family)